MYKICRNSGRKYLHNHKDNLEDSSKFSLDLNEWILKYLTTYSYVKSASLQ